MTKILFAWFCISNIVVALIVGVFNINSQFVYALKDLPYYLLFGFAVMNRVALTPYNVQRNVVPLLAGFIYLILNIFKSTAGFVGVAAGLRQITSIFIIYFATIVISRNVTLKDFIGFTQKLAIAVIVVAWTELALGLWKADTIQQYFKSKSIGVLEYGYPFHFLEPVPDFLRTLLGTDTLIRATSIFLDPINLGHMLVFWLLTSLFYLVPQQRTLRYIFIAICFMTLIASFSKGAWLQLALCLGVFNPKLSYRIRFFVMIALSIIMIIAFKFIPGGIVHFLGLYSGISSGGFIGQGIGMAGNYAAMLGSALDLGVGDSFWGTLIGQIGLAGGIMFVWALSVIYRQLPKDSILRSLLISQVLVSALSENAFNVSSVFGLAMICAIQSINIQCQKHSLA